MAGAVSVGPSHRVAGCVLLDGDFLLPASINQWISSEQKAFLPSEATPSTWRMSSVGLFFFFLSQSCFGALEHIPAGWFLKQFLISASHRACV